MNNKDIADIKSGSLVVFPTDTVYALACIPKKESIDEIYRVKKRNKNKKIIVLISSIDKIKEITDDEINLELVNKFMPGPLTIVCRSNDKFKELVGPTVGFRIPNSKFSLDLIEKVGGMLMTTSANISGEKSATCLSEISDEVLKNVKYIYETSDILSGIPSTIISYLDNKYSLLREGEISFDEIMKVGGKTIETKNDESK